MIAMLTPQLIKVVGVLLAVAALIGVATYAYKTIDVRAYDRGRAEERAAWQARENEELASANALILKLTNDAAKAGRAAQQAVNEADFDRRRANEAETKLADKNRGDISAGLKRLCEPDAATTGQAGGGGATPAPRDTSRPDAAGATEFLAALSGFLEWEARRADRIARKLAQAQTTIKALELACGPGS